jgi:hypothetical protein
VKSTRHIHRWLTAAAAAVAVIGGTVTSAAPRTRPVRSRHVRLPRAVMRRRTQPYSPARGHGSSTTTESSGPDGPFRTNDESRMSIDEFSELIAREVGIPVTYHASTLRRNIHARSRSRASVTGTLST